MDALGVPRLTCTAFMTSYALLIPILGFMLAFPDLVLCRRL